MLYLASCLCVSCRKPDTSDWPEVPQRPQAIVNDGDYAFSGGKISEKVLRNYLSRAITEAEFLANPVHTTDGYWGTEDDERMLLNVGAKFVGRAIYSWNKEKFFLESNSSWLDGAKKKIDRMHEQDPDIIFQAAMFETVSTAVSQVPIPAWVFEAFGKTPQTRNFDFNAIRDENNVFLGQWGSGTCVPDMSREEAQMWFYYMAVRYMEAGVEAIHCGQVMLMASMGDKDNGYAGYRKLFSLIREAAKTKARRGTVLLDAHCNGIAIDGQTMFDFASFPMRLKEDTSRPSVMAARLKMGYLDSIIGKTVAGTTPSGWYTDRLPYLLEFDNFGKSDHPGSPGNDHFVWGYDEISWIARVPEDYASTFVREAVQYLDEYDPVGYLQMPGCRVAAGAAVSPYRCNMASDACPSGKNLEATIKSLWTD